MAVNLSDVEVISGGLFDTAAELTVGLTGAQENENDGDGGLIVSQEDDEAEDRLADKAEKCTRLPLSRIKTIMKLDPDLTLASQEAVVLVAKATELFIEYLVKESFSFTSQNKKKTLQKKDVESSIDIVDAMVFLEERDKTICRLRVRCTQERSSSVAYCKELHPVPVSYKNDKLKKCHCGASCYLESSLAWFWSSGPQRPEVCQPIWREVIPNALWIDFATKKQLVQCIYSIVSLNLVCRDGAVQVLGKKSLVPA